MWQVIQVPLQKLAYRRALRALRRAPNAPWYMHGMLLRRLNAGLATPSEVMAAIRSWKALPR